MNNFKECEYYNSGQCDRYSEYASAYGYCECSVEQTGCTCDYQDMVDAEQKLKKIKEALEIWYDDDWKATRVIEDILNEVEG